MKYQITYDSDALSYATRDHVITWNDDSHEWEVRKPGNAAVEFSSRDLHACITSALSVEND